MRAASFDSLAFLASVFWSEVLGMDAEDVEGNSGEFAVPELDSSG
jgi:hypothetical protein